MISKREIDIYWTQKADEAYEERRLHVSRELRKNGGQIQPWMPYQISAADLAKLATTSA